MAHEAIHPQRVRSQSTPQVPRNNFLQASFASFLHGLPPKMHENKHWLGAWSRARKCPRCFACKNVVATLTTVRNGGSDDPWASCQTTISLSRVRRRTRVLDRPHPKKCFSRFCKNHNICVHSNELSSSFDRTRLKNM